MINKDEKKVMEALRANPELKSCFLEMIDITNSPLGTLDNGDEAEEAVVASIQKTGVILLEEWAQRKSNEAEKNIQNNTENRPHIKKKSNGKHH